MALITCKGISLSYEKHTVLSDLTFHINTGEYLCIVGENGSGKSTLMKALLSLKQPDEGMIQFGDGFIRNEVGYLPQQSSVQKDFPASVWEVVLSGCLNRRGIRPFYTKEEKIKACSNMEKLGILPIKTKSFKELSGGQQQRVLLARALCATQKLLILDEPVAGLDPMVTKDLYHLIQKLNDGGITVIMVSHDIESAVKYASHILHLHNKPMFFGTTEAYLDSTIGKRFLGGNDNA